MKTSKAVITSILALTQSVWMVSEAQAQRGQEKKGQEQRQGKSDNEQSRSSKAPYGPELVHPGSVPIGGYFQDHHRAAANDFYGRPENHGFCPPGLANKNSGCLPPGQTRQWQKGHPLARGVVFYEVPRSVVLSLGEPPSGYRYVRVASDILLIAIGSGMVVDAMEDLVR